ncbi:MAG: globin [Bacteroidetes bacterium]|nr:globin [Bacteroidota bacterium]
MHFKITHLPIDSRPAVALPDPEFLKQVGEKGLRQLVSDHYDLLRTSDIKHLFPQEDSLFQQAKIKSADFFVQICGGHSYYHENRGKPRLMDRHRPFKITPKERLVWLMCYQQPLSKLELPERLILSFWNYLDIFSIWMINASE